MNLENNIVDGMCNDIKQKVDLLLLDVIEEIVFSIFECLPDVEDIRKRIVVGYGPGREAGMLTRDVVFVDGVPISEVVVIKEDNRIVIKKRLVGF